MAKLEWHQAAEVMQKNLVKISTCCGGYGSGVFVRVPMDTPGACCVLTAYHVVEKAYNTGATIEIQIETTQEKIPLLSTQRYIFPEIARDQALIIFGSSQKLGAIDEYSLMKTGKRCKTGVELGWLGYPDLEIAEDTACFLRGSVSAYLSDKEAYLVDGASIHGISGGPVFCREDAKVTLVGIVTNYYPNQVTTGNHNTQAWPGLAMFRTINPLMKLYEATDSAKKSAAEILRANNIHTNRK